MPEKPDFLWRTDVCLVFKTKRGRGVCCMGEAGDIPPALKTAGAVYIEAKSQLYWELWISKDGVEIRFFPAGLLRF